MATTSWLTSTATATTPDTFEAIYAHAQGDPARVPWADLRPHPALVNWLNAVAPSLVRSGSRVCVVGCGLGDDARELMRRGYDVTAFDCSETAIRWAQKIDPRHISSYVVADLFELPPRWTHRFDLVVEINTLQSLLPDQRDEAMNSIESLLSRHGHVLVVCRGAPEDEPVSIEDGPPWALTESELLHLAGAAGLTPVRPVSTFMDDEMPPVRRMRAVFHRSTS